MLSRAATPRASWFSKYVPLAGSGCVLFMPGQDDPQKDEIRDISGNQNHGSFHGATWKRIDSGLWTVRCDGSNDYVSVNDSDTLDSITSVMTVIIWLKPISPVAWHRYVTKNLAADAGKTFYILDWGGQLAFGANSAASGRLSYATGWQFVAGVADGTKVYLIVNDTWSAGTNYGGVIPTNNVALTLMADGNPANYQHADWALFRLFNRSKTAAELLSIYNRERGAFRV